jgi:hypothetical protein
MYIIYTDIHTGGVTKTAYDQIIMKIPNMNWDLLNDFYKVDYNEDRLDDYKIYKSIDLDKLMIPIQRKPTEDEIYSLGNFLFDYRFGFSPFSSACSGCCGSDFHSQCVEKLEDDCYLNFGRKFDNILYCDHTKYQIRNILHDYYENNKDINRIYLYSEDYDCGRYHQEAIAEEYPLHKNINKEYRLLETDNMNSFPEEKNTLYNISLKKYREQFFSNNIDIQDIPFDILYDL